MPCSRCAHRPRILALAKTNRNPGTGQIAPDPAQWLALAGNEGAQSPEPLRSPRASWMRVQGKLSDDWRSTASAQ